MLRYLQVRNLVVVERLQLTFEAGMTALTGETGAGKSILVDALALALGARAERTLIRPGCEQAEVDAVFEISRLPEVRHWLAERSLLGDEEGECFLRRVLSRSGRSRAFINGRPVPRQQLAELGGLLVEIHGQHEHQRLLRPAVQRQLLDAWAGHRELVQAVERQHRAWREQSEAMERLREAAGERSQRLDYLEFQLTELEQVLPDARQLETLQQEHRRLANAGELLQDTQQLLTLVSEGESDALSLVGQAATESTRLARRLAPELGEVAELLENARIQLEEAGTALRAFVNSVEPDPQLLDELDRRLALVYDTARKHRVEPGALPAVQQRLAQERSRLEGLDQQMDTVSRAVAEAHQAYLDACAELSASRRRAAVTLSREITKRMQSLAMAEGRFEVALRPLEEGSANGMEQVEFLVATNPGQSPAPLSSVASGGELSRLSLAIQVATSDLGEVPTLIFDEVDVGIGGAVAETVGHLLHQLGRRRQVFCVTHLAQVAAQADHHYLVDKRKYKGVARTRITPLEGETRVREIARMVGGSRITRQTLAHAEELIGAAG